MSLTAHLLILLNTNNNIYSNERLDYLNYDKMLEIF